MCDPACEVFFGHPVHFEYFLLFYLAQYIPQIEDLEAMGILETLKKLSKTRDQFTAILDRQNNEECVLFETGNRLLN